MNANTPQTHTLFSLTSSEMTSTPDIRQPAFAGFAFKGGRSSAVAQGQAREDRSPGLRGRTCIGPLLAAMSDPPAANGDDRRNLCRFLPHSGARSRRTMRFRVRWASRGRTSLLHPRAERPKRTATIRCARPPRNPVIVVVKFPRPFFFEDLVPYPIFRDARRERVVDPLVGQAAAHNNAFGESLRARRQRRTAVSEHAQLALHPQKHPAEDPIKTCQESSMN